jgi:CheY-like chemotaxis protein
MTETNKLAHAGLEGRRFLVVEDEDIIVMLLEDYLLEFGCSVGWRADNVQAALKIVESESDIDGAILDMNLRGQPVDPVATALATRRIPFCFMTGYGSGAATSHPHAPTISKPFSAGVLRQTIERLMSGAD